MAIREHGTMNKIELPILNVDAEKYFDRCKVPKYLISLRFNDLLLSLADIVINDQHGGVIRRINIDRQMKILQRTLQGDFNNWIFCVTGKIHPRRAQIITLYILKAFSHIPTLNFPYWHRITGGFHDDLRDSESTLLPPLLILDGINIDSSTAKFEKVYDLLETYNHIPRIIIGSGCNPVELMNKVHLPVNRVMFFDDEIINYEVL